MDLKNANFVQKDSKVEVKVNETGIILLPSIVAWVQLPKFRKYFKGKPKGGYFLWVKKTFDMPLTTCIMITQKNFKQDIQNVVIIDKNVKAKFNTSCSSLEDNLNCTHDSKGIIILKENAELTMEQIHEWGGDDEVFSDYKFILEKNAKVIYNFNDKVPPKNQKILTNIKLKENASFVSNLVVNGKNTNILIKTKASLNKKDSSAILNLRVVGDDNSNIKAISTLKVKDKGKGHLDCRGLMISKTAKLDVIPELINIGKDGVITHEASISKVSEEQLFYLMSRGYNEEEAIKLIINGFLSD